MSDIGSIRQTERSSANPGGEITLSAMRAELEELIGKANVRAEEKRRWPGMIIRVCGAPTGSVNAYQITEEGLYTLFHGIRGPQGYSVWVWDSDGRAKGMLAGDEDPYPLALLQNKAEDREASRRAFSHLIASITQVGVQPTSLAELIGRRCRCYRQGDALTLDYLPQRVNMELDDNNEILRIWFG